MKTMVMKKKREEKEKKEVTEKDHLLLQVQDPLSSASSQKRFNHDPFN